MSSQQHEKKLTRRQFAQAAATAGLALASINSASASVKNAKVLKVGLLGCGGRGTGALFNMLEGNDRVKVIALADIFEDRVMGVLDKLSKVKDPALKRKIDVSKKDCFVGVDAYQKILKTDIDILIEGTLPYCRPKHVAAAVDAKKHIFCEKPVAVDPAGIRLFIDAAKRHKEMGLSLVAGTQRRHQKEYIESVQKIQNGAVGEIRALRAYWCGSLPFVHDRKPGMSDLEYRLRNWYAYCWVCGDNIVEQHVHNIDVCNWVMNDHPVSAIGLGGRAWKPAEERYGDIWDNFAVDFEYPNGVHLFSFSRHWNKCYNEVSELVMGSKGSTPCNTLGEAGVNPYIQEHIDLVNSIRGTGPYVHEGEQVAISTMTAIMGRMAAYTGKKLAWDEALNSNLNLVPDELDFSKPYPVGPVPVPGE